VSYDSDVWRAKERVTECLLGKPELVAHVADLANAVDDLNKAWDALSDCLVRQVEARDVEIRSLLNKIAELNKPK